MSPKNKKPETTPTAKSGVRRKILIWTGTAVGIAVAYVFLSRNEVVVEVETEEER